MSRETRLNRRQLLTGAAALVPGFLLRWPNWPGEMGQRPGSERAVGQQLVSFLRHRESARHVGQAYLQMCPQEADVHGLVAAILGDLAARVPSRKTPGGALARLLDNQIRRDFEEGWVVSVGGWMLSRTEARLCALAELG